MAVTTSLAAAGYLIEGVAAASGSLGPLQAISPWHWYLGGEPLTNGLQTGDALLLLAVTAVLVAAGTLGFNRRDVAV